MHWARWLLGGSMLLVSACTRSIEGAPCPCAAGYECCVARNVCYARGQSCDTGGPGGNSATGSGGNGATSGSQALATAGDTSEPSGGSASGGGRSQQAGATGAGGAASAPQLAFTLVATQHNDNARTGANLNETALTAESVNLTGFGELSRRPLRGAVFAQPLVAPAVTLPSGLELDIVYVATMANVLYALDARHPEQAPIWTRTLGASIVLPDLAIALGSGQIWHEVGILGSPVLSVAQGALYAVAATKEGDVYAHRVYKVALSTGAVLASTAIEDADFVNAEHAQRGALTLAANVLSVPFGGYDPSSDSSGWVFAFDTDLLPLGKVRLGNPSGLGVTMSGQGAAADDAGSIFFSTSPGLLAATEAPEAPGSRLLELPDPSGPLRELLTRTSTAESRSTELGSSGPLLIPNSDSIVVVGQRHVYLVKRGASDGASAGGLPAQEFRASASDACWPSDSSCAAQPSSPVFWLGSGPAPEPRLFVWSPNDRLRSFGFDATAGRFECSDPDVDALCTPLVASAPADALNAENHVLESAAQLSVSSHGSEPGSGIVWAAHAYTTDSLRNPDGILRAFDAENLSLAWSTEAAGTPLGPLAPGATPTVSGGRVFVGTADGISSKQTFWDEWITGTPAVANFADESLVLAWGLTTPQNHGFQLKWSTDGVQFKTSSVFDNTLSPEPALASDGTHIYLAWTSATTSTRFVKVAVSDDPSFAQMNFMTQQTKGAAPVPLAYSATTAPALAYGDHRLFLAFQDENRIGVVSSQDGAPFDTATFVTIPDYLSYQAPALAYLNGKLYLLSTDSLQRVNLFVSSDDGAHFASPTPLSLSSAGHPALLALNPQAASEPDFHLVWSDLNATTGAGRIKIAATSDGDLTHFTRTHELEADQAELSISAAWFRGAWYIAWLGVGGANHPNLARYTPGELVTYGVLPAR